MWFMLTGSWCPLSCGRGQSQVFLSLSTSTLRIAGKKTAQMLRSRSQVYVRGCVCMCVYMRVILSHAADTHMCCCVRVSEFKAFSGGGYSLGKDWTEEAYNQVLTMSLSTYIRRVTLLALWCSYFTCAANEGAVNGIHAAAATATTTKTRVSDM